MVYVGLKAEETGVVATVYRARVVNGGWFNHPRDGNISLTEFIERTERIITGLQHRVERLERAKDIDLLKDQYRPEPNPNWGNNFHPDSYGH